MVTAIDIGSLITCSKTLNKGRPTISGTHTSVSRIAVLFQQGSGAEDIARRMSHLTLAQVYAALAYYHANRDEIDELLASAEDEYWELATLHSGKTL